MNISKVRNVKRRNIMLLICIISLLSLFSIDDEWLYHLLADNKNILVSSKNINKDKYYIKIDLDERKMRVYQGDKQIKEYLISGGKPSTPSPLGNWTIIHKDEWGEGFGGGWLGFNVPWGMYGIHGTIHPWLIGENASEGCIRMNNKDLKELYKLIPVGTRVTIVHRNVIRRDLEHGDIGSDVLEVQKRLKRLKYYHDGLDGVFGDQLKMAVLEYQKAKGIRETGVIGIITYKSIFEAKNERKNNEKNKKE